MAIRKGILDQLLAGRDPRDAFARDGLLDDLKKALAERVLNAGLDNHLEGEAAAGKANRRNGFSQKRVLKIRDEGAPCATRRFIWLRVMNEFRNHGVEDIPITVVDGLEGLPEAIHAVFPQALVQTCIVHLIRHSFEFVSWKDRKPLVPALREIYRATKANAGLKPLEAFEAGDRGKKYPATTEAWRRSRDRAMPFFAFPEAVRGIIYATNAIEALNSSLRRAVKIRRQ